MILNISTIDVYKVLSGISNITDLCEVFNQAPPKEPDTPYIVLSKASNVSNVVTNKGTIQKVARIGITVVGGIEGDDQEITEEIVSTITNEIVNQKCDSINDWNGVFVNSVLEDNEGPLLYDDKKRQYLVKDYLFTYTSIND